MSFVGALKETTAFFVLSDEERKMETVALVTFQQELFVEHYQAAFGQ